MTDFKSEYQNEVPKVSGDVKIYNEYHMLTEAFDRGVCTGKGCMPATGDESIRINRHARSVRADLMHKYGISVGRFQEILKQFRRP